MPGRTSTSTWYPPRSPVKRRLRPMWVGRRAMPPLVEDYQIIRFLLSIRFDLIYYPRHTIGRVRFVASRHKRKRCSRGHTRMGTVVGAPSMGASERGPRPVPTMGCV